MMKLVPKPEGFDLRDKRSDKRDSAELWGVQDALYDASKDMTEHAEAVTVIWRERLPDGSVVYRRRNAGPKGSTLDLIVSGLGLEMGWTR